jgi:quercetin dioxygenase-like cupin family protein
MTQAHEIPAARPFAVGHAAGERIWFAGTAMELKATASTTGGELFVMETEMPEGFSPPLHVHHSEHESFYVLDGTLEIVVGGERLEATPGSFAFLPSGIAHTFRAIGGPVRVLSITTPGGIEDFFRGAGRPAEGPGLPPPAPLDVALITRTGAEFDIEIVGPPLGVGEQS